MRPGGASPAKRLRERKAPAPVASSIVKRVTVTEWSGCPTSRTSFWSSATCRTMYPAPTPPKYRRPRPPAGRGAGGRPADRHDERGQEQEQRDREADGELAEQEERVALGDDHRRVDGLARLPEVVPAVEVEEVGSVVGDRAEVVGDGREQRRGIGRAHELLHASAELAARVGEDGGAGVPEEAVQSRELVGGEGAALGEDRAEGARGDDRDAVREGPGAHLVVDAADRGEQPDGLDVPAEPRDLDRAVGAEDPEHVADRVPRVEEVLREHVGAALQRRPRVDARHLEQVVAVGVARARASRRSAERPSAWTSSTRGSSRIPRDQSGKSSVWTSSTARFSSTAFTRSAPFAFAAHTSSPPPAPMMKTRRGSSTRLARE